MENKKYINLQGICPFCSSDLLEYDGVRFEGDMCYFPWTCKNCDRQGEEWYNMTFSGHNIINENGDIVELMECEENEYKRC